MTFEPINKYWQQPTKAELAATNAHLKTALVAVAVVAVIGWGLFFWRIAQ
jgi:hypothetical protein